MALPHVNLLSKVDLVEKFGKLQFGLDYYTEVVTNNHPRDLQTKPNWQVLDLEYLLDTFPEDAFTAKYKQLNTAMTGLVSDYRCDIAF